MNATLLAMLPLLIVSTLNRSMTLLVDPDIWWHLSNARLLLTTHHFIYSDPYSFTVLGQRWIDWEWLSELPFWFSYKAFGLQGIYLVTWLLLVGNIMLLYLRGYWMSRRADAALWTAAIGMILMTVNSGPRTIEFAYLTMSVELSILEAADRGIKKFLWLLPPLFCLWINLHGMWFSGIVLFGIYIVCGLFSISIGAFEQKAIPIADRNRLLWVFAASIVALFVNPYGWRLMWSPLDMMLNQHVSTSTIAEWLPLSLSSFEGRASVVAILLMVVANFLRGRKWKLYELSFVILGWYAAISHHRFTYFAAVLTTPMLARDLARSFNIEEDTQTIPAMNALLAAGALGVIIFMYPSESALRDRLGMMFPLKSIEAIQPTWRTFDWDYLGGMMDFQGKPTFMDSRFDSFEHAGVMQEYQGMMQGHNTFQIMDKYLVDHAILKDDLPLAETLERTQGWHVVKREKAWEGNYLLFARDPAPSKAP